MTKKSSNVAFNTINEAFSVNTPGDAVVFAIGPTEFGKSGNPSEVITTPAQYKKRFGNPYLGNNFSMYALRLLEAGVKLRVCRIPLTGAVAAASAQTLAGRLASGWVIDDDTPSKRLFKIKAIAPGTYYNNVTWSLTEDTTYTGLGLRFSIAVYLSGVLKETYDLTVQSFATTDYLDEIVHNSNLITVEYYSSVYTSPMSLTDIVGATLTGGTDGSGLTAAAYSSALSAFNPYDDGIVTIAPQEFALSADNDLLTEALFSYASGRQDLVAVASVPKSITTAAAVITYVNPGLTLPANPKFCVLTYGGVKVLDDTTVANISEVADVVAMMVKLYNKAPWLSPSGPSQGVLSGVNGVVNNFGTAATAADRELMTNEGINPVIYRNNQVVLWNAYTMADEASQEKFLSVIFLEIYIRKTLIPTVEKFLSQPNEFQTWLSLYYNVKPFLDDLIQARAFFSYEWKGDQFATSLSDLQVNDADDVQNGEYKAILEAQLVSPIVTITIEFYKKSLSVS
jgi:phage tail sheath protein FI